MNLENLFGGVAGVATQSVVANGNLDGYTILAVTPNFTQPFQKRRLGSMSRVRCLRLLDRRRRNRGGLRTVHAIRCTRNDFPQGVASYSSVR